MDCKEAIQSYEQREASEEHESISVRLANGKRKVTSILHDNKLFAQQFFIFHSISFVSSLPHSLKKHNRYSTKETRNIQAILKYLKGKESLNFKGAGYSLLNDRSLTPWNFSDELITRT